MSTYIGAGYPDLQAALDALGADSGDVARTLKEKGIKGVRGSATDCPIANYLRQCGFEVDTVSPVTISVSRGYVATPAHIEYFIRMYDMGGYHGWGLG